MEVNGKVVLNLERKAVLAAIKAAGATLSLVVLRPEPLPATTARYLPFMITKTAATDPVGMKLVTVRQGGGGGGGGGNGEDMQEEGHSWATHTLCEGLVAGGLAYDAGILAGDVVKEVNGLSTFGQSHEIVMRTVRQTAGKLLLVVLRMPAKLQKKEKAKAMSASSSTTAAVGTPVTRRTSTAAAAAPAGSPGWLSPSTALPMTRANTPDESPTRRKQGGGSESGGKGKEAAAATAAPSSLNRRFTVYDQAAKVPKSVSVMARLRSGSTSVPAVLAVSEMDQAQADGLLRGKTNGAYLFREARGVIVLSMLHSENVSHHQLKM